MRRTKLVCTIGPASAGICDRLVQAGMNIARVNFSHGTDEQRVRVVEAVRRASTQAGTAVGILADLRGPKVRLGPMSPVEIELRDGQRFVLRSGGGPGDASGAPTTHPGLGDDLRPGDRVLLADGAAELSVASTGDDVVTEVVRGGCVRSGAGVNVPSERLSLPALSDRDLADVRRAVELGVDFIGQSFVRHPRDVTQLRGMIGDRHIAVVAKIETRAAVEAIDDILTESDAIMLARGDLGVELAFDEIPMLQKRLVAQSVSAGVPVIVATQMLESMISAPRPTRAEASDVANAVLEGCDGILLSAETAVGRYPIEAARAAVRITEAAERDGVPSPAVAGSGPPGTEAQAIAQAAAALAHSHGGGIPICCYTKTGITASLVAATRPAVPIFAFSPDDRVVRRLTLLRGVVPMLGRAPTSTEDMVSRMDRAVSSAGLASAGTPVVMVAASPGGGPNTNFLKVHRLGS